MANLFDDIVPSTSATATAVAVSAIKKPANLFDDILSDDSFKPRTPIADPAATALPGGTEASAAVPPARRSVFSALPPAEEPVDKPEDSASLTDTLTALPRGLYHGVTRALPEMAGKTLEFIGGHLPGAEEAPASPPVSAVPGAKPELVTPEVQSETGNIVQRAGRAVSEFNLSPTSFGRMSKPELEAEKKADENRKGIESVLYQVGDMLGPSVIPGIAAGTAARVVLGVGKLARAARAAELAGDMAGKSAYLAKATELANLANNAGGLGAALLFGGQQAQQTVDSTNEQVAKLRAEGKTEEADALKNSLAAKAAPYLTGAIEAAGEYFGTKYLGKLFGVDEAEVARKISKGELVKDLLNTMGVEVGTEIGQQFGEAGVEKLSGIRPEAQPWEESKSVILPTIGLTLLTGGLAHGTRKLAQKMEKSMQALPGSTEDTAALPSTETAIPRGTAEPTPSAHDINLFTGQPTKTGAVPQMQALKDTIAAGRQDASQGAENPEIITSAVPIDAQQAYSSDTGYQPYRELKPLPRDPLEAAIEQASREKQAVTTLAEEYGWTPEIKRIETIVKRRAELRQSPVGAEHLRRQLSEQEKQGKIAELDAEVNDLLNQLSGKVGKSQETPGMPSIVATQGASKPSASQPVSAIPGQNLPSKAGQEIAKALPELDREAHAAATSPLNALPQPTEAAKSAGNYKMGHLNVQGLDVSIENPKGSVRSGVSTEGKPWSSTLQNHYGYLKGTVGRDKDHIDAFIGPNPESQKVYVVDQIDPKTGNFDEHKTLIGFDSKESANTAYHANYEPGWRGAGAMTEMSMSEFKAWLASGNTKKAVSYTKSSTKALPGLPERSTSFNTEDRRSPDRRMWDQYDAAIATGDTEKAKEIATHLAYEDRLTGLIRREGWQHDEAEGKHGQYAQRFFMDLDNFHDTNVKLSHEGGDQVLAFFGRLIKQHMGKDAEAARWGGDEFVGAGHENLEEKLKGLQKDSENIVIPIELKDGTRIEQRGIRLSFGIGKDYAEAYNANDTAKQERKAAGLRHERHETAVPGGTGEVAAEGGTVRQSVPAKEVTTAIPEHIADAVEKPQDVSTKLSVQTKQQTKDTLNAALKSGAIKPSEPIRLTTVEELREIIKNKAISEGQDFEGRSGISAQMISGKTPVVAYGPNDKISAAIIFPEGSVIAKGEQPNEVKIDSKTAFDTLRFVIDGYKEIMSAADLDKVVNIEGKKESPAVPSETPAAKQEMTVGSSVRIGKSPEVHTISKVIEPTARERELGEQYFDVRNSRGELDTFEAKDLKPIKAANEKMTEKIGSETPSTVTRTLTSFIEAGNETITKSEIKNLYEVKKGQLTEEQARKSFDKLLAEKKAIATEKDKGINEKAVTKPETKKETGGEPHPNEHGVYSKDGAEHTEYRSKRADANIYVLKTDNGWINAITYAHKVGQNSGMSETLSDENPTFNSRVEAFKDAANRLAEFQKKETRGIMKKGAEEITKWANFAKAQVELKDKINENMQKGMDAGEAFIKASGEKARYTVEKSKKDGGYHLIDSTTEKSVVAFGSEEAANKRAVELNANDEVKKPKDVHAEQKSNIKPEDITVADIPADLEITTTAVHEKTGKTFKLKENAREAFTRVQSDIDSFQEVLKCLGA